jgi:hypothetical protein
MHLDCSPASWWGAAHQGRVTLGAAKLVESGLSCANSKHGRVAQW